jgi:flagellin-like hook-associated protein FlgL
MSISPWKRRIWQKNQILQQAATAMLAQANQGQQGLLQLIQR